MQAEHQTTQVPKYPSIQGQNLTQELCLTVMMQCVVQAPMSSSYGPPMLTAPGPPQVPARIPPGVDRACSMQDEGKGGIPDHLPLGDVWQGHHTGPLYEEGYRVL